MTSPGLKGLSMTRPREQQVPFFFKQRGTRKKKTGRTLHGRTYDEMPMQTVS